MTPTLTTSLAAPDLATIRGPLADANASFAATHPGEPTGRQPTHTVYGGAQLFKAGSTQRMGALALRALETYAPTVQELGNALGWGTAQEPIAQTVYDRVVAKLEREPVEDFRIDFEDGYGNRPDEEEDAEAVRCAHEVAAGMRDGVLPPFIGIRVKPLSEELAGRSLRTLDLFLTSLVGATGGTLPEGFVVTVPKITSPGQVTAFADALDILESHLGLPAGTVKIELMVETPQSILDEDGNIALPALVRAARGRCRGAHFGTYDYTALCNITAAHQVMAHPSCNFAKHVMQVSLAQRGILLSDGATNIMPVGPHRATDATPLTHEEQAENRRVVHNAWRIAYDHIRHSLRGGFYQGWDLHPAQIPIRYAATYAFFLEGLDAATARLSAFLDKAAQATLLGDVFDDAATGQGLLNVFLRGIACGAISEAEALATGITLDELRRRSFLAIVEGRR
jgi:citrate lyase beta subunit